MKIKYQYIKGEGKKEFYSLMHRNSFPKDSEPTVKSSEDIQYSF